MTSRSPLRLVVVVLAVLALAAPTASADPVKCQKTLLAGLRKYKKTYAKKAWEKCLDAENVGKIPGPCPDTAPITTAVGKINPKIDAACSPTDLAALGYPSNCMLAPAETAAETTCSGLPATTGAQLAACLECWKAAELAEFTAILYASHAVEVCGSLDAGSATCSEIDCTTPEPVQRNLGNTGEDDCQRGIGKGGVKYLLTREKVLEKCGLIPQTRAECLDGTMHPEVALGLSKAASKKMAVIKKKCGNRTPMANPPFCCRVGTGNSCMVAADRNDCTTNLMGTVMENKTCTAGSCAPVGGGGNLTWWENCPEASGCPGASVGTVDELIACVDASADAIVDEVLCLQFPTGWPCPAESTTTTTTSTTTSTT